MRASPSATRKALKAGSGWCAGGDQIDYIDEKTGIRRIFAAELSKHGIAQRMDAAYAKEMAELGIKTA